MGEWFILFAKLSQHQPVALPEASLIQLTRPWLRKAKLSDQL